MWNGSRGAQLMMDNVLLSNHLFIRKYIVTHFQNHFKSSQQRKTWRWKPIQSLFRKFSKLTRFFENSGYFRKLKGSKNLQNGDGENPWTEKIENNDYRKVYIDGRSNAWSCSSENFETWRKFIWYWRQGFWLILQESFKIINFWEAKQSLLNNLALWLAESNSDLRAPSSRNQFQHTFVKTLQQ